MFHAVGSVIVVRQGRKTIATTEVTDNDDFTMEIPDELRGEIEISIGLHNAAPSLAVADGNDIYVNVLYSNVNNSIA